MGPPEILWPVAFDFILSRPTFVKHQTFEGMGIRPKVI
jgi:hypothetical protein